MKTEIKLGDTVQCIHTGFKGTAVCRSEFFNGCVQYSVIPKWDGKINPSEIEAGVDSQSLKVIKKGPRHKVEKPKVVRSNGGPTRIGAKMRGF